MLRARQARAAGLRAEWDADRPGFAPCRPRQPASPVRSLRRHIHAGPGHAAATRKAAPRRPMDISAWNLDPAKVADAPGGSIFGDALSSTWTRIHYRACYEIGFYERIEEGTPSSDLTPGLRRCGWIALIIAECERDGTPITIRPDRCLRQFARKKSREVRRNPIGNGFRLAGGCG